MQLHHSPLSSNCLRVRLVAHELGTPLTLVEIDFQKGQHRSPEFLALNPNGKVPVLVDGDLKLWESPAIILYLATLAPAKGLLPTEARARAEVDRWMFWNAGHFGNAASRLTGERVLKKWFGLGDPDPARVKEIVADVDRYGKVLDDVLAHREYVCGRLTVADFSIAASLSGMPKNGLDVSAFKNIARWFAAMQARDSWKACCPEGGTL